MVRLSDKVRGWARIRAEGAETARLLDLCVLRGIDFWAAAPAGELCLEVSVRLEDAEKVLSLADDARCELTLLYRRGAPLKLAQAKRRRVLWLLPLLLGALLVAASFFTWEIEISGNETVSDTEILHALEESGVFLGAYHPAYVSDSIRSQVMLKIPEIKWISVRVFGSRADVLVRERTEIPEVYDRREPVNVVASAPGIIEQLRAFRGKPQFIRGQTVAKGDLLISGSVPSTYSPGIVLHAYGEVIARTWHEVSAVMPLNYSEKLPTGESHSRWTLKLGDNRIKFYSSSGIWGGKCDNIISEFKLGIKGLFELPVSLIREETRPYETAEVIGDTEKAKAQLERVLADELSRRIGEKGEVLRQSISFSQTGDCMVATLLAECRQDIAREVPMTAGEISQAREENNTPEENTNQ